MKKDEYRARVQRFLTGPFVPADLTSLFLFLRGASYGRSVVHDFGNMIAHGDYRHMGISVERVSAMYTIARYLLPRMSRQRSDDLTNLAPEFIDVMDATLLLSSDNDLRQNLRMNHAQVSTVLTRVKRKILAKEEGNLHWQSEYDPSSKEFSVMQYLTSVLISKPVYTPTDLVEDTKYLLIKHGFMDVEQESLLDQKKDYLSLFALSVMHGVTFKLPYGQMATAETGWSTEAETAFLNVSVCFVVTANNAPFNLSMALFDTTLLPADWIDGYDPSRRNVTFIAPIELTDEPKLRFLS